MTVPAWGPTYRVATEGYGVRVEVRVEHAPDTTGTELARTLQLATAEALARHRAVT